MIWKRYFKYLTRKYGGLLIFFSNVSPDLLALSLPDFYRSMLEAWLGTKAFLLKNEISKRNQIIYNNRCIRIQGQICFHEDLFLKNVFKIHHIVDKKGELKSITEFKKMGLNNIEINIIKQLYEGIPFSWKTLLNIYEHPCEDTELSLEFIINGNPHSLQGITSKYIYSTLLKMRTEKSYATCNLERTYNMVENDTRTIFLRPRKSTIDRKLREFQYKMLYNLIYTNKHLYTFKHVVSNLCSFCNKHEETYEHLFCTCEKVANIWKDCGDLFSLSALKNLHWQEIHIGIKRSNMGEEQLLNHIILLTKHMIFKYSSTQNRPPIPQEIKKRIIENRQEEKELAGERGTLTLHFRKWDNFHS